MGLLQGGQLSNVLTVLILLSLLGDGFDTQNLLPLLLILALMPGGGLGGIFGATARSK